MLTSKDIAEQLGIARSQVSYHRKHGFLPETELKNSQGGFLWNEDAVDILKENLRMRDENRASPNRKRHDHEPNRKTIDILNSVFTKPL